MLSTKFRYMDLLLVTPFTKSGSALGSVAQSRGLAFNSPPEEKANAEILRFVAVRSE